ncbi:N-acetylmuramoyl-L-alanine amidase family protein [Mucilaginibacter sp. KACC 22063]|uniref:N-acetylmuramoyl-L-alanine amidase family protein n=1 Tax=Mucilaginibacter sp. KACC 22063 TaxID=3025666 RepID=UPI002366A6DA|nr:N-acetylmuramoyl-L-alanine amidase [Mucilaginibacter sp. KACC 22063]WDF53556.1 N-acetylmuramoyl-L-alanine amidase [Mucilaginibacter sp. KACC 22063]
MNSIFAVSEQGSKIMKNKAFKSLICTTSLLLLSLPLFSHGIADSLKRDSTAAGYRIKTIVVDAGHGGKRPGAYGSYSVEKNVTLALAFKLQQAIQKDLPDVRVVMTRTTDDDILWQKRSDIANEAKGDLFISLHCNSLPDRLVTVGGRRRRVPDQSGRGVLLLVYGFHRHGDETGGDKEEAAAIRENLFEEKDVNGGGVDFNDPTQMILLNAFKNKYRKNSIRMANILNDEFTQNDGRSSEGVREQSLLVLCHSAMPAVLVETGYINNPKDEAYLNSEDGQNEIVSTIVRSIKTYKKELEQPN